MNTFIIAAVTLDGKIAKEPEHNSYSWTSEADKTFFKEKTKDAGVVIVGRKTWEAIGKPLEGRLTIVMTKHPEKFAPFYPPMTGGRRLVPPPAMEGSGETGLVEFTNKTPAQILEDLESRGYESAAVAGGAEIYAEFLRANLVDEMFLTIHPLIFGEGISFVSGVSIDNFKFDEVLTSSLEHCLVHLARSS